MGVWSSNKYFLQYTGRDFCDLNRKGGSAINAEWVTIMHEPKSMHD